MKYIIQIFYGNKWKEYGEYISKEKATERLDYLKQLFPKDEYRLLEYNT